MSKFLWMVNVSAFFSEKEMFLVFSFEKWGKQIWNRPNLIKLCQKVAIWSSFNSHACCSIVCYVPSKVFNCNICHKIHGIFMAADRGFCLSIPYWLRIQFLVKWINHIQLCFEWVSIIPFNGNENERKKYHIFRHIVNELEIGC